MKILISIVIASVALVGCGATAPVAKTSLEIQAVQTKLFEADKGVTFKSVISVLQDLGYIISSGNLETGLITAESPTQQDTSGSATFAAVFGGVRTEGKTVVTASVEEFGAKSTRVRLNFVNRQSRSGAYGQRATDDQAVHDPKPYQAAFEKIGEAIFIRLAQK